MKRKPPQIKNETCYDGRSVNGVVRWVFRYLDLDGKDVMVKVKHHTGRHGVQGRYYPHVQSQAGYVLKRYNGYDEWQKVGPKVPVGVNHLIVCRIGKPGVFPVAKSFNYDRKDMPPEYVMEDWQEALVSITAHEAMHLRHYKVPKSRNRGHSNETDTQWAAYRLLMEWRSTH